MHSKAKITTKRLILTSFFGDLLDVAMNATVALLTGSFVMFAGLLQGLANIVVDIMLIFGFKRSRKRSNRRHPFGYGMEMYFWAMLAGVFTFFVVAGLAIYFGIQQIRNPEVISNLYLAYIALSIGVFTNGYAFTVGYRGMMRGQPLHRFYRVFANSSRVAPKTTMVADLMGASSALLGLIALGIYGITGNLIFDGIGATLIGIVLGVLALILIFDLRDLVTGRSARVEIQDEIRQITTLHPAVEQVLDLKTMVVGPDKLLVNIEVHIKDDLDTDAIERVMDEIKLSLRHKLPQIVHIQIELETPDHEIR